MDLFRWHKNLCEILIRDDWHWWEPSVAVVNRAALILVVQNWKENANLSSSSSKCCIVHLWKNEYIFFCCCCSYSVFSWAPFYLYTSSLVVVDIAIVGKSTTDKKNEKNNGKKTSTFKTDPYVSKEGGGSRAHIWASWNLNMVRFFVVVVVVLAFLPH